MPGSPAALLPEGAAGGGRSLQFPGLVQAVEDASPADIVLAVGRHVRGVMPRATVTFWVADYSGYSLERLDHARPRESVDVATSIGGQTLRTQTIAVDVEGEAVRVYIPLTVRG